MNVKMANKIKEQMGQKSEMTVDDFEYTPFNQGGRLLKAKELFGNIWGNLTQKFNRYLIA